MSKLIPSILTNPNYATNSLDTEKAGWYQIEPKSSNVALRVNYSDIGLSGEVRLNNTVSPPIFQGNNGSAWVTFNATQGVQGPSGQDFTNAVNFNNLGANSAVESTVALGSVFASTLVDISQSLSNVNIRSLQGSSYIVNSNLTVTSTELTQNSNVITINSKPLPYNWDFSGTQNTLTNLKNITTGWGETSKWIVKTGGSSVSRGQAVRITKETTTSNIVIQPITYTTLTSISPFTTPLNILGIATEDASAGGTCSVCTKGITTVKCTNSSTSDFTRNDSVSDVGIIGLVGKDGFIFNNTKSVPTVNYIKAGYFLENGSVASNGSYCLFYVEPSVQIS
tara:strand:- start:517 stop:1530 length:1014 start_codon:yes stop_codon:yes gene_type:complete